ncbi:hypothetical protein PFISCL1PPCAC_4827, partial [Pristionchus fissidentatus]
VDPQTFSDLLDLIYPCFKRTSCCQDCSSSRIARLDLALRLKLRCAVQRLLADGGCCEETVKLLIECNAFATYRVC